jgi:hypothetical protein
VESVPGQQQDPAGRPGDGRLEVVVSYCVLLLFGALESLVGCFQYSRSVGSFPLAAVVFAVGIGVTCVLGAWGMSRPLGGLMPGVGWFIVSFVLAMSTPGGSIVITNTGAGKWFLFGGSVCVAAGVVIAFAVWSPTRSGAARRGGSQGGFLPRRRPAPKSRA